MYSGIQSGGGVMGGGEKGERSIVRKVASVSFSSYFELIPPPSVVLVFRCCRCHSLVVPDRDIWIRLLFFFLFKITFSNKEKTCLLITSTLLTWMLVWFLYSTSWLACCTTSVLLLLLLMDQWRHSDPRLDWKKRRTKINASSFANEATKQKKRQPTDRWR